MVLFDLNLIKGFISRLRLIRLADVNILPIGVLVFVALLLCLGPGAGSAFGAITVTPSAGPNGSIDPSTPQTVNYNDTVLFTVTPNVGYYIHSVTGCNGTLSGNTYITGPVTADCIVNATFSPLGANTYVIVFLALIAISTGVLLIKRRRWIQTN